MGKLTGNPETIKRAQSAPAGDKSVYINFDAIAELPDEYEVCITEVKYDPKNIKTSFSEVGSGNYMPNPELMYRIAEACGISGGSLSDVTPIIEFVDINPMLMKPIQDAPTERKMTVGRKVSKFSTVMQEDGSILKSSVCTCMFNVWERCQEAWSKEELYTEGYTKSGQYPPKYDKPFKRKAHFDTEMKFAHAKAETKAHLKTIRELAKLVTGYKATDLTSGSLYFAKVRRSNAILKAESAARLQLMASGGTAPAMIEASQELFGTLPDIVNVTPEPKHVEPEPKQVEKTKREIAFDVLKKYIADNVIPEKHVITAGRLLDWFSKPENTDGTDLWIEAMKRIKTIEADIPEALRIKHGL